MRATLRRLGGARAVYVLVVAVGFALLAFGGVTGVRLAGLVGALVGGALILGASIVRLRTVQAVAEVRYRNLVEELPLITYIDSPRRERKTAAYVSPQIEAILGVPLDEWQHDPDAFPKHLHPRDRERVLEAQEEARLTGEPLDIEYRMIKRDGEIVWLRDIYTTVRDENGLPWYTQGFATDITPRKIAEEDREQLLRQSQLQNEELLRLDRMKDEFIALVSHELRTPLTSIRGYLELLVEEAGMLPTSHRGWVEVIDRNTSRLQALVEDLLLAAQAEEGSLRLNVAPFDLAALLSDCLGSAAQTAAARSIVLAHDVSSVGSIHGDSTRIAQVFDNVLSNALKFTSPGGRVGVRAVRNGRVARIEVEDDGMGIPATEQPQLFRRFFRGDRAQNDAIVGAGLGLSISKAIVEAHDGSITFRSTEGSGTTFTIELPVAGPVESS
jgi:PAS domain S-box-containing protein